MRFIRRFNPVPPAQDFWSEFTRPNPYRLPILLVSALLTGSLILALAMEDVRGPVIEPEIVYIETLAADRSIAEIREANLANQRRKDAIAAEAERREERRRELWKSLGRASGMDVEQIEREAEARRAAGSEPAEPAP